MYPLFILLKHPVHQDCRLEPEHRCHLCRIPLYSLPASLSQLVPHGFQFAQEQLGGFLHGGDLLRGRGKQCYQFIKGGGVPCVGVQPRHTTA